MMRVDFSSRSVGFAAAVLGVVAVGPDAALLRTQQYAGGSTSVIGVWRYVLLSVCNGLLAIAMQGWSDFAAGLVNSFRDVALASAMILLINFGFMISLLKTDAAKALCVALSGRRCDASRIIRAPRLGTLTTSSRGFVCVGC